MPRERDRAATVVSQEGTQLTVQHHGQSLTARMLGFPPGFRLRAGDRVILTDEPSGVFARPLVRAIRCRVRPDALERDRQVEVGGRRLATQESTVLEVEPDGAQAEEGTLWVVERAGAEGPSEVIAGRWQHR